MPDELRFDHCGKGVEIVARWELPRSSAAMS